MIKMMMLLLLLVTNIAFAGILEVEWGCPKTFVQLSFDEQGKLVLKPDVLNGKLKTGNSEETSACVTDFQKKIQEALKAYQALNCQSSKSDLCVISSDYLNLKVVDRIQSSNLIKKYPGIKINTPATVIPESKKPDVQTGPATPEAFLQKKIIDKEIDPKNLSQSFDFKNKNYKVSDFDKVVGENIENVFGTMNREEAKQYAQNYMVAKSDVLKATIPSEKKTQVLNNLNQMFGYIYGEKGAEELAKILECKPEDELKPITDILSSLEDTKKVEKCKDLAAGEHKVFKKEASNYYGTGNYLLKRTKEGNYQAVVNVNFKSGRGSVSTQEMMARAKGCLNTASLALKGPNGEKLQFSVLTPDEVESLPKEERPEPYNVTIEPVGFGTNAGAYAQDSGCPTITHEMLHLLGLCDEYGEDRPQYGNMWNCRVVTKVPSIMRDHINTFNNAIPRTHTCECSQPPCSSVMSSNNEDLKKLYTGESAYDAVPYQFRNKYCTEKYVTSTSLLEPSKSLLIKAESDSELMFESRFIMEQTKAPQYKILKSEITCRCPSGDKDCSNTLKQTADHIRVPRIKNSCPNRTKPVGSSVEGKKVDGVKFKDGVIQIASDPTLPSLLQPQQFNKILAGPCSGKGADPYNECADFAYKSDSSGPCNVPERCRDDKYYMGGKQ
jgi:hypothetical protein